MDIKESDLKICKQVDKENKTGKIRPLICYALDADYVSDKLWEAVKNEEQGFEFKCIVKLRGYLALALWVRFFYEEGDGRNVWECLPIRNKDKKTKKFIKDKLQDYVSPEWENELSKSGQWYEWMRSQCWVLSVTSSGNTSDLVKNNKRLSGYLSEVDSLSLQDYVKKEWEGSKLPPRYISTIAKKYPEQVKLILESLCGIISDEKLKNNPWLVSIRKNSLKERIHMKADWYLRDADIFLVFKGTKRRVHLGDKQRRLTNGGLSLKDVRSAVEDDHEIRRGIMYSYGNRLPSFDLSKPQLFMGRTPKLIDTRTEERAIPQTDNKVFIYLPDDYEDTAYALSSGEEPGGMEFPLTQIEGGSSRIYCAMLLNVHKAPLYLVDRNSPEENIHCFSKKFGGEPMINLCEEDKNKRGIFGDNKVFYFCESIACFVLENIPPCKAVVWRLENPDGSSHVPVKNNLNTELAKYDFPATSRNGRYKLFCEDEQGKLLASVNVVYICDRSKLTRVRIDDNPLQKNEPGYGRYEVLLNGKRSELLLPVPSGEGIWRWYKEREQSETDISPGQYLTPTEWLKSSWRLRLDIAVICKDGEMRNDLDNLRFNGTPISLIVADTEEMLKEHNFLDACFYRHDSSSSIYQYFPYGEKVRVTYAGKEREKEIFSYRNEPYEYFSASLVIEDKRYRAIQIWHPHSFSDSDVQINGKNAKLVRERENLFRYDIGIGQLESLKIGKWSLYPIVDRAVTMPGRKRKDIITIMRSALEFDQFNFFALPEGDDWLGEFVKNLYEKDFLSYLKLESHSLWKIDNSEPSASTFMLGIVSFLKRNDDDFREGLRQCGIHYPEKFDSIGDVIMKEFSKKETADYLKEKGFWNDAGFSLGYDLWFNKTDRNHEQLFLKTKHDLLIASIYACNACTKMDYEAVDSMEEADDVEEMFFTYLNLCRHMQKWKELADDVAYVVGELEKRNDTDIPLFLLKMVFSCRMHKRLAWAPEFSVRRLPLDPDSKESEAMRKCLISVFDTPGVLVALMMVAAVFEYYIEK